MLGEKLIDYVALDYKAPPDLFQSITGLMATRCSSDPLNLLIASGIPLEIRTTVHADLLDEEDINSILKHLENLEFSGTYYVQNFRAGKTLGNLDEPFNRFDVSRLNKHTIRCETRGFGRVAANQ
jgi:pyruvate formate lyase activating enzyme